MTSGVTGANRATIPRFNDDFMEGSGSNKRQPTQLMMNKLGYHGLRDEAMLPNRTIELGTWKRKFAVTTVQIMYTPCELVLGPSAGVERFVRRAYVE